MMLLYVAAGSAIGGSARFLVATLMPQRHPTAFPLATLIVNVSGSLLLGLIIRYATATETVSPEVRAFLTIGICGGYTTFSTFSLETATLIERGRYDLAIAYIALSITLSVAAVFGGMMLGQTLAAR
jgi:fluoride exporter